MCNPGSRGGKPCAVPKGLILWRVPILAAEELGEGVNPVPLFFLGAEKLRCLLGSRLFCAPRSSPVYMKKLRTNYMM